MGGGGGYGDPLARDPALVCEDVRTGKVSAERAREVYGVIIDPTGGTVDEGGTTQLRSALRTRVM
jgi:N-methylhydantoinase B